MKKTVSIVSALLIGVAALWASTDAKAFLGMGGGEQQQQQVQQAPVYKIHDEETFKKGTKNFHLLPYGDINLEFEISLPTDWSVEPNSKTAPDFAKKLIAHVASFSNPPSEAVRLFVTVEALQLDHEIDATSWLSQYLFKAGYTPEQTTTIDVRRASATYVLARPNGASFQTYVTAQISGNLVILARYEMPLAYKEYMGFLQKKSIDSFRLVYLQETLIEQHKAFTLVDALKLNYPESWNVAGSDLSDITKLSMQLHNRNPAGVLEGFIRVYAARRSDETNFVAETTRTRDFFNKDMNIEFLKMESSENFKANSPRFHFGRLENYRIKFKKGETQEQEFRLLVLADPEWYIFITMISPRKDYDLYTWARHNRTFELIAQSLK